jgi:uncharacterized membrane protein YqiK
VSANPNLHELRSDAQIIALEPVLQSVRQFAAGLVIKSAVAYERAAGELKRIKGALAQIEDSRTRITVPLNSALRETNGQAKEAAAPFLADETVIKNAMIRYSDEQDRLRLEEQRRANERAEVERRRLQAIADAAAHKAHLEAEEKRRQAEQEAKAGREAEAAKLREQAERVEATAAAKVEKFEDRAAQVVAPIASQAAPKVAGVSIPVVWDFKVTDEKAIPREYFDRSDVRIRKVVQAMQGNTNIPGVRVFQKKRIAAGVA